MRAPDTRHEIEGGRTVCNRRRRRARRNKCHKWRKLPATYSTATTHHFPTHTRHATTHSSVNLLLPPSILSPSTSSNPNPPVLPPPPLPCSGRPHPTPSLTLLHLRANTRPPHNRTTPLSPPCLPAPEFQDWQKGSLKSWKGRHREETPYRNCEMSR